MPFPKIVFESEALKDVIDMPGYYEIFFFFLGSFSITLQLIKIPFPVYIFFLIFFPASVVASVNNKLSVKHRTFTCCDLMKKSATRFRNSIVVVRNQIRKLYRKLLISCKKH